MNYSFKQVEQGRSMIEMLGVLAIIGVLSVGAIAGYSKAMMKFKINKSLDQVAQIATNIRTLYAQQKTCDGLSNRTAIRMGVVPDELGTNANTGVLINSFGGAVNIDNVWGYYKFFGIAFNGLPKEACVEMATKDWGDSNSSGLKVIRVVASGIVSGGYAGADLWKNDCQGGEDGYEGITACAGGSVVSLPMPVSVAAEACNCETENTCSVGWVFIK